MNHPFPFPFPSHNSPMSKIEKMERAATRAASRDAMRHIARDVPCPRRVAFGLSLAEHEAITAHAYIGDHGCYRLPRDLREGPVGEVLFARGIVEARGPYLTGYGHKVRRAALESEQ